MLPSLSKITDNNRQHEIEHKLHQNDHFQTMKQYFEQLGGDWDNADSEFHEHENESLTIIHYRTQNKNQDTIRLATTINNGKISCSVKISDPTTKIQV